MADRLSCTAGHRTEAADFAVASGKPIAQVAADLGINEKILGRWVTVRKKELANHPVAVAAAKTETAEMRAARKCMRELELENEFLKSPDLTLEAGASRFLGHV
ncbi:MAG: hypothetical protein KHY17_06845 [Collinsella sp.]|nr:hypothetical protein [Collinsella sp.]